MSDLKIPAIPGMASIAEVAEVERRFGTAAALKFIMLGCDPLTGPGVNAAEMRRSYVESLEHSGLLPALPTAPRL